MSYLEPPECYFPYSPYAPPVADSPVDYTATGHSPMSSCSSATAYSPLPVHSHFSCSPYAEVPYGYGTYAEVPLAPSPSQPLDDCHKHGAQLHYAATVPLNAALEAQDVARCLECLDSLASAIPFLAAAPYPSGMRAWLRHVQKVTNMVKRRSVAGRPLTRDEAAEINAFADRWRTFRGGANDMGAPEAQIVLLSLQECLLLF